MLAFQVGAYMSGVNVVDICKKSIIGNVPGVFVSVD